MVVDDQNAFDHDFLRWIFHAGDDADIQRGQLLFEERDKLVLGSRL